MLSGILGGLLTAWILELFGFGTMLISVLQPFATIPLTINHYYVMFALTGLVGSIFRPRVYTIENKKEN